MKTITVIALQVIEETKSKFYDLYGKNCEDEKKLFINWYIQNHKAPLRVLINDLSDYYLHISEDRIIRILNESK